MKKIIISVFIFCLYCNLSNAQWEHPNGPFGAMINCMAVSGNNIFSGTAYGGLYLSTNNGATWAQSNIDLLGGGYPVLALTVNDTNIFAGTNDGVYLSTDNGINFTATSFTGTIYSLCAGGSNIYAGTASGIYKSTNNGTNWIGIGYGTQFVDAIAVKDDSIVFAGVYGNGICRSMNNGLTWSMVNTGLPNNPYPTVYSIAISGTTVFIATSSGVYKSTNNGSNWVYSNSGLSGTPRNFAISGTTIFACSSMGVFKSTNNGTSWSAVNTGLVNKNVKSLVVCGGDIYAGTDGNGVYKTNNGGLNWFCVNTGMTNVMVRSIITNGSEMYIATKNGAYKSTDYGFNWSQIFSYQGTNGVYSIAINKDTNVFIGTYESGIFLSTDQGTTWNAVNNGLTTTCVTSLVISDTNIFAGTNSGIFLSTNNGTSWTSINTGLVNINIRCMAIIDTIVLAGTDSGLFMSINNGYNWVKISPANMDQYIQSLATSGNKIYAGYNNSRIYRTDNFGNTWNSFNLGIANCDINSLVVYGQTIFAGVYGSNATSELTNGVYLSLDNCMNWSAINTGLTTNGLMNRYVSALSICENNIFLGTLGTGIWTCPISTYFQVWPGNTNDDSIVNNYDLLPIGLYYGTSGIPRENISNAWAGQNCFNWPCSQFDSTNMKHVDCNGDGVISALDTVAINLNYGLTHAMSKKIIKQEKSAPILSIVSNSTSYQAGDTARFDIIAGDVSNPVNALYGIAYNIHIDPEFIEPGSLKFSHISSWLGNPAVDALKLSKKFESIGIFENAIIRMDHINQTGYGIIGKLQFKINDVITSIDTMNLSISSYSAVNASSQQIVFNTVDNSVIVLPDPSSINSIILNNFSFYPNPAYDMLYLEVSPSIISANAKIEIYDILGKAVLSQKIQKNKTGIDINSFKKGMYLMKLINGDEIIVKKFVKE